MVAAATPVSVLSTNYRTADQSKYKSLDVISEKDVKDQISTHWRTLVRARTQISPRDTLVPVTF